MKIYDLVKGQFFTIVRSNPDVTDLGIMKFLGMDGMYAKVQAVDKEVHDRYCAGYSTGCPFFAIHLGTEVEVANEPDVIPAHIID